MIFALCLTACEDVGKENDKDSDKTEGEVALSQELIGTLTAYLKGYNVEYDMPAPTLEEIFDGIKDGDNALKIGFDDSDVYYACAYCVEKELVLGPFQGPVACTRIAFGRGVCGTAWREQRTITVADVDLFPGHIACNSASRSEIVVPLMHGNEVKAVLDIDSDTPCAFDETDATYLKRICDMLSAHAYDNNAL